MDSVNMLTLPMLVDSIKLCHKIKYKSHLRENKLTIDDTLTAISVVDTSTPCYLKQIN